MNTYEPSYYNKFKCVAANCSFTCCRDWKITVDSKTEQKWTTMATPEEMKCSNKYLSDFVKKNSEGDSICLDGKGLCPFLREDLLCHVVAAYGEDAISETCHIFPREKHIFDDRIEYTLTMGCPEALNLLWKENQFTLNRETHAENNFYFRLRNAFVQIMNREDYSVSDILKMEFYILQELDALEQPTLKEVSEWTGEAALNELYKAISHLEKDDFSTIIEQNELFLDLVENYRKANIYTDIIEPLSIIAEEFESTEKQELLLTLRTEFENVWSRIEDKIRLLFAEEIYSTLYLPEGDLYSMLLKMEWIGLTYATIKQACFLSWHSNRELSDTQITALVTILIRMTGYSEADIEEYLENSFESSIWSWGYFSLIV